MMDFIMRCCKRCKAANTDMLQVKLLYRIFLVYLLMSSLAGTASHAANGEIRIESVKLFAVENGYHLDVDSKIVLNKTLERALEKGLALYFVTKFVLMDSPWYWIDEEVARSKMRVGLRYIALTRQYHLSHETFVLNFLTLAEALQALGQFSYPLDIKSELSGETDYHAVLRVWLDLTRLPKPFQVETLGSEAWSLSSDSMEWRMKLPGPTQPLFIKGVR